MAQFHELTVTNVEKTIRNAVIVTLKADASQAGTFGFVPGQYLTLRRKFADEEVRRSYSICSGLDDGVLQVGIKQVEGGVFSSWANENLRPGDIIDAMPPKGRFFSPIGDDKPRNYLVLAGGSGITPILSILKYILSNEPKSSVSLVYANQGVNSIMFREELEDLKNVYLGRLAITHILEADNQNADLFVGRLDEPKCAELFTNWVDVKNIDCAYICGPEPMMLSVTASLKAKGLHDDQIRYELFTAPQMGRAPQVVTTSGSAGKNELAEVELYLDGATRTMQVDKSVSLLEAALKNSIDAPFSCKAGVCSSCRCKVLEGDVEMVANHSLEDYEVENGYVLACQSYAVSDKVTVDFDG